MTDLADHAQGHEEAERDAALQRHRQRTAGPLGKCQGRLCVDCGERIPAKRLAAHPAASRCIEDARRHEERAKHFKKD